jgi:hypothetical protein
MRPVLSDGIVACGLALILKCTFNDSPGGMTVAAASALASIELERSHLAPPSQSDATSGSRTIGGGDVEHRRGTS